MNIFSLKIESDPLKKFGATDLAHRKISLETPGLVAQRIRYSS